MTTTKGKYYEDTRKYVTLASIQDELTSEDIELLRERFLNLIDKEPSGNIRSILHGCWRFKNSRVTRYHALNVRLSCGIIKEDMHRVSFFLYNGPLVADLEICHEVCGNKSCPNPDHLTQETHLANISHIKKHKLMFSEINLTGVFYPPVRNVN